MYSAVCRHLASLDNKSIRFSHTRNIFKHIKKHFCHNLTFSFLRAAALACSRPHPRRRRLVLICLCVLQLGDDLSLVAARVVAVRVQLGLLLGALLARVAAEHGLVLVVGVVHVLVLVKVGFGHFGAR
jgi:hypothetical protein